MSQEPVFDSTNITKGDPGEFVPTAKEYRLLKDLPPDDPGKRNNRDLCYGILQYDGEKDVYFIDDREIQDGEYIVLYVDELAAVAMFLNRDLKGRWQLSDQRFNLPSYIGHEIALGRK